MRKSDKKNPSIKRGKNIFYYGVGSAGLTPVEIQALSSVEGSGDKVLTFTNNNQVTYFSYPVSLGALSSILDQNDDERLGDFILNAYRFIFPLPNGITGALDYYVYELDTPVTQTDFEMTFIF